MVTEGISTKPGHTCSSTVKSLYVGGSMFMDFMVPNYPYKQVYFNVFPFLTCVVKH